MADFSKDQGGIQSSDSTQFTPIESGTPASCTNCEPPASERPQGGPGPGVGNTRGGIR